ncbi:MAG: hypothetical protein ACLTS6_17925 [Anaerobutyricum sp.]
MKYIRKLDSREDVRIILAVKKRLLSKRDSQDYMATAEDFTEIIF